MAAETALLPAALALLQACPVAQAALGAALAAVVACEGKQRQLLLQSVARGAVQGASERAASVAEGETALEVKTRLAAIAVVVKAKVLAAREQRAPHLSGSARARRNVAEHVGFGGGPGVVWQSDAAVKNLQRGLRRHASDPE